MLTTDLDGSGSARSNSSPLAVSAGQSDDRGPIWTARILLRIRRLGVRVPPSAPRSTAHCDLAAAVTAAKTATAAGLAFGSPQSGEMTRDARDDEVCKAGCLLC